jgi:diguanylate cyclase (GGDEF)-like protein
VDGLTGLGNRRSLEEKLRFLRGEYCLAMLDIDHFKAVNDRYGHAEGDNVLRWVAGHIGRAFGDGAYRYGGEEFAVVLPALDLDSAGAQLEALRRRLESSPFHVRAAGERRRRRRRNSSDRRKGGGLGGPKSSSGSSPLRPGPGAAGGRKKNGSGSR